MLGLNVLKFGEWKGEHILRHPALLQGRIQDFWLGGCKV